MKYSILFFLIAITFSATAQESEILSNGSKIPNATSGQPVALEDKVGCTFYDSQTNGSIANSIVVNSDGTIATAWTFSPNANYTSNPPYYLRGSGYNYFDGTNWTGTGCVSREESIRTGYTNIINTSSGYELLVAHSAVPSTNFSQIAISRRTTKGTGSWTLSYPWGSTSHDTWAKATSAGDNVYVIFNGSGAPATITSPPNIVLGQNGPIFFSRSLDGGATWDPKTVISLIDSNFYTGFAGDSYSIDARGSTVAISYGDKYTDIGLLKSTDYGVTWTKTIVQQHPIPFYTLHRNTDINHDGTIDTVFSNGGDSHVLIDLNGMCHVWFSAFRYFDADSTDSFYNPMYKSDGLEYWNENMAANAYVQIATAQDFNGNGHIDFPTTIVGGPFTTCTYTYPFGNYENGLTQNPSAGIDASGKIYLSYSTVDETTDTTLFASLYRHVYMKTLAPPYNPSDWTYPYDIVPSLADGGEGYHHEAVYACVAKNVVNNYAYVLYQRDTVPGNSLATAGTCERLFNLGQNNDIIVTKVDISTVSIETGNQNNLFVSQNYPNPTNGITHININLKNAADLKLVVNDIVGKTVHSETKTKMQAGNHSLTINTSGFESGIYYFTVSSGGQKTTRCMVVQ